LNEIVKLKKEQESLLMSKQHKLINRYLYHFKRTEYDYEHFHNVICFLAVHKLSDKKAEIDLNKQLTTEELKLIFFEESQA